MKKQDKRQYPEDLWEVGNQPEETDDGAQITLGPRARIKARRTVDQRFNSLTISKGPQLFVDYRFIQPGSLHWVNPATGDIYPLHCRDEEGPIDARAVPVDIPQGVRIVAWKAGRSEPFPIDEENGALVPGVRIFQYQGKYISWNKEKNGGIAYMESDDGWTWKNKAVCSADLSVNPEASELHGEYATFIDPSAPDSERFKLIYRASPRGAEHREFRKRVLEEHSRTRPDDIDPVVALYKGKFSAMYGAVSADGIHWKGIKGPQIIQFSDTINVITWDDTLEQYVWYERNNWFFGRRCVGISLTSDFGVLPAPQMLLKPSLEDDLSDDWYTNSKTVYPGTRDYHFLFPARYNRRSEGCDLILFSSPDGFEWSRVPGGPVLETGNPGSWDGGCIFGGLDLLTLGPDTVGLPFMGHLFPHKYPRNRHTMKSRVAYALWDRERLASLKAVGEGHFTTFPLLFEGRKLRLNLMTILSGEVKVEAADQKGKALPGRSFDDADPVTGDLKDHIVTWKGEEDLGHAEGQTVILRFSMRDAELFAFELL